MPVYLYHHPWKLNPYSMKVLKKLRFKLAEIQEKFILFSPTKKFKKIKITRALNWDSYADPKRNIVNINKNRRHFKGLIENKAHLIRIALHPRDPVHALKRSNRNDYSAKRTRL